MTDQGQSEATSASMVILHDPSMAHLTPELSPGIRELVYQDADPEEYSAIFCGMRKNLSEILGAKSSSYLCNVTPMMYSQADMFYSPRGRLKDDGQQHDHKAHLHFNSAVRQAVEQYSDVLTSPRCRHMNGVVEEVVHLCPLLQNDLDTRNKIITAIKSYISNAVAHYKRKQRKITSTSSPQGTGGPLSGGLDDSVAPSPEEYPASPGSSSHEGLIDYSTIDSTVPVDLKRHHSEDEITILPSQPQRIPQRLTVPATLAGPHPVPARPMRPTLRANPIPTRSSALEISNIRSMEVGCVASSVEKPEPTGFRFSEKPTMEQLRSLQATFAKDRDWDQFHQPRNLLLAMVGEVGEVSEIFQWRGECKEGLEDWSEKDKKHLGQELSDVLMYLIRLAEKCHIDLPTAAMEKMGLNGKKYPAHQVYGSSKKYTEYE